MDQFLIEVPINLSNLVLHSTIKLLDHCYLHQYSMWSRKHNVIAFIRHKEYPLVVIDNGIYPEYTLKP